MTLQDLAHLFKMFNFQFRFIESLLGFQCGCFTVLHINHKPMSFFVTFFLSSSKLLIMQFGPFKTSKNKNCKFSILFTFVGDTPYGHQELLTHPCFTYFPFNIKTSPSNLHKTLPLLNFNISSLIKVFYIFSTNSLQAFSLGVQTITLAQLILCPFTLEM